MVMTFTKSRKQNVKDFFQSLGLTETQRLSQSSFTRFLARNFGLKEKSVMRLYDHFKGLNKNSPLISVQSIITEVEDFIQQMQVVPAGLDAGIGGKVLICAYWA